MSVLLRTLYLYLIEIYFYVMLLVVSDNDYMLVHGDKVLEYESNDDLLNIPSRTDDGIFDMSSDRSLYFFQLLFDIWDIVLSFYLATLLFDNRLFLPIDCIRRMSYLNAILSYEVNISVVYSCDKSLDFDPKY